MATTALTAGPPSKWAERAEKAESALSSMRRSAGKLAAAKPVSAAITAGTTIGTFQGLKWLKKNYPKQANAFGIPLSFYIACAGLGGGIMAMVTRNKMLEPYADYMVAAGTGAACHVEDDVQALSPAAGCWDPAEGD